MYIHRSDGEMIVICLYVDDLFLFTASPRLLKKFKSGLKAKFEMEDLGEARLVLGMQITRDRAKRTLTISQRTFLTKFMERLGYADMKAVTTPMVPNATLVKAPEKHTATAQDRTWYQSAIGSPHVRRERHETRPRLHRQQAVQVQQQPRRHASGGTQAPTPLRAGHHRLHA